ncbi:MAG: DnaJ domain-containing protein [Deltaproteobacteria bacterium]|nr:DnaJ domain-containing protein [Deltaproteobacteria bacterium]
MNILSRLYNVVRSNLNRSIEDADFVEDMHYDNVQTGDAVDDRNSHNSGTNNLDAGKSKNIADKYYANLELAKGATYTEIKAAYRRLLRKYHPDKHEQNVDKVKIAEEITKVLNEAMAYFEKEHAGGRL